MSAGPGNQTDPHVSGSLVSYTNVVGTSSEIRYHNLATGEDFAIPNDGHRDSLSDVSGSIIVFRRVFTDGNTARPIMAFDAATKAAPRELDPQPGVRRGFPSIGGRTVAWLEFADETTNTRANVVAYDLDSGVATPLTNDGVVNREVSVSTDGSVITWAKCSTRCDVYQAVKAEGGWRTAQVTDSPDDNDVQPESNGEFVVYAARIGQGDNDIHWKAIDGTRSGVLTLPGAQVNPNVNGNLVVFEHLAVGSIRADLWLYDLGTDTLYQLTNTPDVNDTLNDVSLSPDGTVRVVWASPDEPSSLNNDISAMSFRLDANRPPDCSGVTPSTLSLWPPNHQFEPVTVAGASDPDGDHVTLSVISVTQDEALDGVDDGSTAPDALLGSTPASVLLRAERSGSGDGRVYRLAFHATDSRGGSCSGTVTVTVPLTGAGSAAVDSGATFDSLVPRAA